MKRRNNAFTLIELIVVMAIIGVLVLLAAPKFLGYTEDAKQTRIKNDIKVMENKIEEYLITHEGLPDEWTVKPLEELQALVNQKKLYEHSGEVKALEIVSYKVVEGTFLEDTKLESTFYASNNGKVFYKRNEESEIAKTLPAPFLNGVELSSFLYYEQEIESNGVVIDVYDLLDKFIVDYYNLNGETYTVKPEKVVEIELFNEGLKASIEGLPFAKYNNVQTVLVSDFPTTQPTLNIPTVYDGTRTMNYIGNDTYYINVNAQMGTVNGKITYTMINGADSYTEKIMIPGTTDYFYMKSRLIDKQDFTNNNFVGYTIITNDNQSFGWSHWNSGYLNFVIKKIPDGSIWMTNEVTGTPSPTFVYNLNSTYVPIEYKHTFLDNSPFKSGTDLVQAVLKHSSIIMDITGTPSEKITKINMPFDGGYSIFY